MFRYSDCCYSLYEDLLFSLSGRIRITRELEVEPDEPVASTPSSELEAESESQPKSTLKRKPKRSRKDPAGAAAEHLEAKVGEEI